MGMEHFGLSDDFGGQGGHFDFGFIECIASFFYRHRLFVVCRGIWLRRLLRALCLVLVVSNRLVEESIMHHCRITRLVCFGENRDQDGHCSNSKQTPRDETDTTWPSPRCDVTITNSRECRETWKDSVRIKNRNNMKHVQK